MEQAKRSTESPSRLALLLGLAVVLGGVLLLDRWAGWSTGVSPDPGASGPHTVAAREPQSGGGRSPGGDADRAAHPLAGLALDELRDTVRRPLFEKTRRPVESPPRSAPAPPTAIPRPGADPNALTLLGVLKSDSGDAIALLRRNASGQNVRLQEGETVDGWTIERIAADAVVLKQGETRIALQLFAKR